MQTTKHTPDWIVHEGEDYVRVLESANSSTDDVIAEVYDIDHAHLIAAAPQLLDLLDRYVSAYPAFRIKPIGADGSPARIEQEMLMALEEKAKAVAAKAKGDV